MKDVIKIGENKALEKYIHKIAKKNLTNKEKLDLIARQFSRHGYKILKKYPERLTTMEEVDRIQKEEIDPLYDKYPNLTLQVIWDSVYNRSIGNLYVVKG